MSNNTNYKSIFKSISILGGVQVFNVIISLIRGKAVALLIGTEGMGLNSILNQGLNLIRTISSLGIKDSAVRDISIAYKNGDSIKINKVFTVFSRWIWVTAALGIILTVSTSYLLSKLTFGDADHIWSYIWISSTFVFGALSGGIYTLLRGTMKIKSLALANILGSVTGLLTAVPIYYFWGIDGVVPAIIVSSITAYLVSLYFKKQVPFETIKIGLKDTFNEGKGMVSLGISLSLTTLLNTSVNYYFSSYISRTGSLSDLGLYSAGLTIVNGYVGMIFNAIGTDFYPRLSGVIQEGPKWKKLINDQLEILVLILSPLLVIMMATAPILIRILLSSEFLGTIDFIVWSVLGLVFRGLAWTLAYAIIAHGKNKLLLTTEIIGNVVHLSLNMVFYKYMGLKGLGISMLVGYFFSTIMLMVVMKWKFKYFMSRVPIYIIVVNVIFLSLALFCIYWLGFPNAYYSGIIISLISITYSLYELNKRLDIKKFFTEKILKKKINNK